MKAPTRALSFPEFVGMQAMLFATLAFSIDAMLPAIPQIAEELSPNAFNRAQLIITSFVLGMGVGTFFTGPLSDMFGRKPVVVAGVGVYVIAALYAWHTPDIEHMLIARFLMGLGASGPRVVSLAMIRDLYKGREMARVMSFVMTVFILVPAVAPSIGAVIINVWAWRALYPAFIVFTVVSAGWLVIRQPETLPQADRRPINANNFGSALREIFTSPLAIMYIVALSLGFGQMFAFISTAPQLFTETYQIGESFPLWFAFVAMFAATASFVNARLVMTLGMRRLATGAFLAQFSVSVIATLILLGGIVPQAYEFYVFIIYMACAFFMIGLTFGNLNALVMEPFGHIAGLAAAIVGSVSTIAAVLIAVPLGQAYDGTPFPLMVGAATCSGLAYIMMRMSRRHEVAEAA